MFDIATAFAEANILAEQASERARNEPLQIEMLEPRLWYLLRTVPNREKHVTALLRQRGVNAYLPTEIRSRRSAWARRVDIVMPVFPGIVFVADYDADLRRLRDLVFGISDYIRFGGNAAAANAATIAIIRDLEVFLNLPMGKRAVAGRNVRVVGGPFDGWIGKIERLDGPGRIKILLEAIQRQVPVILSETQIEVVRPATRENASAGF